jgi:hypothetical protein
MRTDNNEAVTPCKRSSIAKFIDTQVENLKGIKSESEIASDLDYDTTIVVSMLRRGDLKVPLDNVPRLARALRADAGHLFRLALEQYWPDHAKLLLDILGCPLEADEEAILMNKWRAVNRNLDALSDVKIRAAVDVMIEVVFGQQRR